MDYSGFRRSNNIEDVRGVRLDPLQTLFLGVDNPQQALASTAQFKQFRYGPYDNDIQNFADSLRNEPNMFVAPRTDFNSVLARLMGQN